MPIKQRVDAKTLGKRFAELVRQRNLPVQSVWVREGPGFPELRIIIESMSLKAELPVHRAIADLQREYPDSLFDDLVINPAWFHDFRVEREIPHDATRVEIRT